MKDFFYIPSGIYTLFFLHHEWRPRPPFARWERALSCYGGEVSFLISGALGRPGQLFFPGKRKRLPFSLAKVMVAAKLPSTAAIRACLFDFLFLVSPKSAIPSRSDTQFTFLMTFPFSKFALLKRLPSLSLPFRPAKRWARDAVFAGFAEGKVRHGASFFCAWPLRLLVVEETFSSFL